MIEKVISGGQIGVDQAGLKAARDNNIKTGGFAPRGYRTTNGPMPHLLKDRYGLVEAESDGYPQRTALNVKHSDGTIIIALDPDSPGSKMTAKFCRQYKKPYHIIDLKEGNTSSLLIWKWIRKNGIKVLNVAGNRDSVSGESAYEILNEVFKPF